MKKSVKSPDPRPAESAADGLNARAHTALFASAVRSFSAGNYREAKRLFDEASNGPTLSVNESALMYSRMCQKRIERDAPELTTPEDRYNYAIGLINTGRYNEARPHLEAAVAATGQSHYIYALAIAEGRAGAIDAAAQNLRRAIQIDPTIRSLARRDPDFHPLLQVPQLRDAIASEHTTAG